MDTLYTQVYAKEFRLKSDGTAPLVIRVRIDSERVEIPTGVSIDPKKWDKTKQKAKGSSIQSTSVNAVINTLNMRITKAYNSLSMEGHVSSNKPSSTR